MKGFPGTSFLGLQWNKYHGFSFLNHKFSEYLWWVSIT